MVEDESEVIAHLDWHNGHRERVGAVVVTFNPDLEVLGGLLLRLSKQVAIAYVVDNGSGSAVLAELDQLAADTNIEVIPLGANRGIAAAHNVGMELVSRQGIEFALLFDQDSVPELGMVDLLVEAHQELVSKGHRVAAVGPVPVDSRTGSLGKFVRVRGGRILRISCADNSEVLEVDFLISSGSLISVAAIAELGGMNESYFIDHVDTEWCIRARMQGYQLFGVCGARLSHALGDQVIRIWFGRWREVSVHSPLRDYYSLRNTVALLRHTQMSWNWRFAQLLRAAQLVVFFSVVPPRRKRLRMMLKGVWHGLSGRMGIYRNV